MAAVIDNAISPQSDESQLIAADSTVAVAIDTRPILEAALAKQKLIELQLVTLEEWDAAAEAAGSPEDLVPILAQLQLMDASWNSGSEERFPVLTSFQAQKTMAGKPEDLWLDHYILLEKLGSGGMGDVFKARNTRLPRLEAIKTIQTASLSGQSDASLNLERFQREAQLLAQLQHAHLTTIFHAGHDRDVQFIAIEYVRGRNLKQYVEELYSDGGEMSIGMAIDSVITVAEVLAHAHERGVIHRDIKPANIMVTPDGGLKVLDLGIAQLRDPESTKHRSSSQLTQGAVSLGTPEVMAPEQWADAQSVTAAADIYSLGCTLFYMLTGRMPFVSETREELLCAVVSAPRPNATDFREDVPPELSAVIRRMLAHYPQDRYQSCAEVIAELLPFANRITASPLADTGEQKHKVRVFAVIAGIMGALAVVAAAGWQHSSATQPVARAPQVDELSGRPFENLATPMIPAYAANDEEKVLAAYNNDSFLHTAQWLLELQSAPQLRHDSNLDVQMLVAGKPSTKVFVDDDEIPQPDEFATIRVRAPNGGYLTMLVFGSDGNLFQFHWTEPLESGRWLTAFEPSAASAGDDLVVLYLTESDPLKGAPQRPSSAAPLYFDKQDNFVQGQFGARYTKSDQHNLEAAFAKPAIYQDVIQKLKTGESYPFTKPPIPPATWWARKTVPLHVVNRSTEN